MHINFKKFAAIIISLTLLTSCEVSNLTKTTNTSKTEKDKQEILTSNIPNSNNVDKPYNNFKPNEIGNIMILMYHDIGKNEGEWVRTPENFRKDLETLYKKGYRLISIKDFVNNNINVPAGTTPVILTLDDGTAGQFKMIYKDNKYIVDPDCAVGILEDFCKKHPDFGLKAVFYIFYPVPFRQKELIAQKLRYLAENGIDIGNHTFNHDNLRKLDEQKIQETLGKNVIETQKYIPGYEVDSLALPYGIKPREEKLVQFIVKGKYADVEYNNKLVLLVGSSPAYPLYSKKAGSVFVPRIRASEINTNGTGLYDWLKYFDSHPEKRYISDGDSQTVSIPYNMEKEVDLNKLAGKRVLLIK